MYLKKRTPRVLVISFNSFRSNNANGRTLMNLFDTWPEDDIAQFYISSDVPDFMNCKHYYRVTDEEALKAIFGKKVGTRIHPYESKDAPRGIIYTQLRRKRKKPILRYFRQLIWETDRWINEEFYTWINDFNPDIVLLFSGNNAFIDKIALHIADRYKLPIVLYNCEDYYLKPLKVKGLFSYINKYHCDKAFENTMRNIRGVIYNCDKLYESYKEYFSDKKSVVLMNSATDFSIKSSVTQDSDSIAYLGNIAIGREESLCQIAEVLGEKDCTLEVYGPIANKSAKEKLLNNKYINYHGCVSYEECCEIMYNCKLLIHCESFLPYYRQDLRHAFSTKIADSLACGTCLFVYAPHDIAIAEYIMETKAAILATNKAELKEKLFEILDNKDERKLVIERAKKVVKENHSKKKTAETFMNFMNDITKNKEE